MVVSLNIILRSRLDLLQSLLKNITRETVVLDIFTFRPRTKSGLFFTLDKVSVAMRMAHKQNNLIPFSFFRYKSGIFKSIN